MRRKARGYSKHLVEQIGQVQGKPDARNSNQDAASSSQRWQKDALLDGCTGKPVATEEDQEHLIYPEGFVGTGKLPGDSGHSEVEGKDKTLATPSPYFAKLCATNGEGLLDRETNIWSQFDGSNERPECEHSYMVYIYVCHSSSCSSSSERLYGKSTIHLESTVEISETVISKGWEVDHGTSRNYRTDHD